MGSRSLDGGFPPRPQNPTALPQVCPTNFKQVFKVKVLESDRLSTQASSEEMHMQVFDTWRSRCPSCKLLRFFTSVSLLYRIVMFVCIYVLIEIIIFGISVILLRILFLNSYFLNGKTDPTKEQAVAP